MNVFRPLLLCGALIVPHATAQTAEVVLARSAVVGPAGLQPLALFSPRDGLIVRHWPGHARGDLVMGGSASRPRFDARGRLFFEFSVDDGEDAVLMREVRVLEPNAIRPRAILPSERAPAWALGSSAGAVDGPGVRLTIDPGHGGSDPGALGNGLREADINLDIALRLEQLLIADTADTSGGGAWDVLMTRTADTTVSLSARTAAANAFNARSFLSIHNNSFSSSTANGSETYCFTGTENGTSGAMRNRVHAELIAAWGLTNRGVKTANFFVLRNTVMPAVLLEGGFISNPGDASVMRNATQRQRLALFVLYALQEHHGFARHTPRSGPSTGKLRGVVFDANVGMFSRIADATVALADGRFAVSSNTGYFEFDLPPGPVDYAATAPGFGLAALSRTVIVGADSWGSFGLVPQADPTLETSSASIAPGATVTLTLGGAAPSSAANLLLNVRPGIPLVDLSAFGFGTLWTDLNGLITVSMGAVDAQGRAQLTLRNNGGGFSVHVQALALRQGVFRFSNGAAFTLR